MKNTTSVLACAALLLTGCAAGIPKEPMPIWNAAQVAPQEKSFVFCEEDKCPVRTVKTITQSRPVETPADVGHPVEATPNAETRFVVHFPWGSSKLDRNAKIELASITNSEAFKTASAILVAGRTDPSGSQSMNEKLAVRQTDSFRRGFRCLCRGLR